MIHTTRHRCLKPAALLCVCCEMMRRFGMVSCLRLGGCSFSSLAAIGLPHQAGSMSPSSRVSDDRRRTARSRNYFTGELIMRDLPPGPASPNFKSRIRTPNQGADVYKAKQSLGQNFLVDKNVARKICAALEDKSEAGKCVVEVGPGKGSLTALLLNDYPKMKAVEIDQRSVEYLASVLPSLEVIHASVLDMDWSKLSDDAGGEQLSVIGNLPYYITSQILFSVIDAAPRVRRAVVTMQLEVAQRVCAPPGSKTYGILSVAAQLHGTPRLLFHIPPHVFQPKPDVDSALVCVDFPPRRRDLGINECHLRTVVRTAFQQRRKMLRQSLKPLLSAAAAAGAGGGGAAAALPEAWGTRRPEQLSPDEFVELTRMIYGPGSTPPGVAVWRGALDDAARTPGDAGGGDAGGGGGGGGGGGDEGGGGEGGGEGGGGGGRKR